MFLVVNSGSSSLKLAVFEADLAEVAHAGVEKIGSGGPENHARALDIALKATGVSLSAIFAAGHRVVHGGADLVATCALTPAVEAAIAALVPLAPLHNPGALAGIRALREMRPDLAQYAAFDTAFHATNDALATTYALPADDRAHGLRRYGFHGLSYAAIVRKVQEICPENRFPKRLLSFHLGNGSSICAIANGRSVATTMGYSPLDGLTMGTRAGGLDPAVVLDLARRHGVAGAADILNRKSGLLALGGTNDMRALHGPDGDFAVAHYCYWAVRHAGSMVAAMGGVDAITFTGGIGENDRRVRSNILNGLAFLGVVVDGSANIQHAPVLHDRKSRVAIWIIPAEEERQIALEMAAMRTKGRDGA